MGKTDDIEIPAVSLPSGGGSIKGIDEQFKVNPANGTLSLSIPIPAVISRGTAPQLSLGYESGSGNGEFGLGWSLSVGFISRKTDTGVPKYSDEDESDTFALSGAEDLVPVPDTDASDKSNTGAVKLYRPRTEGAFMRIERHSAEDGAIFWKVTDRDGTVTFYGISPGSKLCSPDGKRIFRWYPELSYDIKGNCVRYCYSHESDVPSTTGTGLGNAFSGIYLNSIRYGNRTPFFPGKDGDTAETEDFRFSIRFNYVDSRPDAFSSFRSGFEVKCSRLCTSIVNVNSFAQFPGGEARVSSLDLEYDCTGAVSMLHSIRRTGYSVLSDGSLSKKSLPPTVFSYSQCRPAPLMGTLDTHIGADEKFTDLYGNGLPGLLSEREGNWYFRENLGDGTFSSPVAVTAAPSFTGRGLFFSDLDADGSRQMVNLSFEPRGFFEISTGRDGKPLPEMMRRFPSLPSASAWSEGSRMIDLTGDGKPDILIAEDEIFTWYCSEGRNGWSGPGKVFNPLDEESGPRVSFCDPEQSIFLADMSGDGLSDIVRVRNGEVCWWPNLGYGRFGRKVTMEHSPVFSEEGSFNPRCIRFADLDGSGTSDIIYAGGETLVCWQNIAGSHFSPEPLIIDNVAGDQGHPCPEFVDLFGHGTPCMVWTSGIAGDGRARFMNLMSGLKPYIMTGYVTGGGCSVKFGWASSATQYIRDRFAGRPWPESLPFPVICLSRVEKRDLVTGQSFVSEYSYHDGHYDHTEREFRGFGEVVTTDTEQYERQEGTLDQKPVITRTVYHTGSVNAPVGISVLPGLDPSLAENPDTATWKDAHRAARGMVLSETVSDSDGRVYSRTESSVAVMMVSPSRDGIHSVFMPVTTGTVACSYEGGEMEDPRMTQSLNLRWDDIGNVLDAVSIIHPRRQPDASLPEDIRAMQAQLRVTLSRTRYTNDLKDRNILRLPYLSETFVLEDVPHKDGLYTSEDFKSGKLAEELSSRSLTLFCSESLCSPAPEGRLEGMPLIWCSYTEALTDEMVALTYGDKVNDTVMAEAGYRRPEGRDGWWIPSGRAVFIRDGETADEVRKRFFIPLEYESALGARTRITYHDTECLMPESVEDAFGNVTRALEYDWRSLSPTRIEDANGNVSAAVYDELGFVAASAECGKDGEADNLDGFSPDTLVKDRESELGFLKAGDYASLENAARKLLRNASVRYVYALEGATEGSPMCAAVIRREVHSSAGVSSPLQLSFEYTGDLGQIILRKEQAEAGDGSDGVRWLGNGRTILNNKGNPVMKYEPYFSDTHGFESEAGTVCHGVTPLFFYDPLGRLVRTEFPDGTFSSMEFDKWKVREYDPIDNVIGSEWLSKRKELPASDPERDAAAKSETLALTPVTTYLDSSGRTVYTLASDGSHRTDIYDRMGNLAEVRDSRSVIVMKSSYDLTGGVIRSEGADNGSGAVLHTITGEAFQTWDGRGHCTVIHRDIMGRPTYTEVSGGEEKLDGSIVDRFVYAEDLIAGGSGRESLRKANLLGRLVRSYDTSGCSEILGYDFAGRILSTRFRLARDWKSVADWKLGAMETGLEDEEFITSSRYDALGRVTETVLPDGTEITTAFGRGSLMKSQTTGRKGGQGKAYIKSLSYNEKRQRLRIVYGNDVSVRYSYDPLSFRLKRVFAARRNGEVLQDLNYSWDAAGNLTHLSDKAIPVEFNRNRMISGESDYTYDSNYRLIRATGRENGAALREAGIPGHDDQAFRSALLPGDAIGLRPYTESYEYDSAGNISVLKHHSEGNSWTRLYEYAADSNRLLSTRTGDTLSRYTYDPSHGFMTSMPHLAVMEWNFRDELTVSSRQACASGSEAAYTRYCYDGSGQRIRKINVSGKNADGEDVVLDERIYIGAFELYRCRSGVHAGLERTTVHLTDDGGRRFAMIERRNDVDDGSPMSLDRYQLDNLTGSSCMELDAESAVISHEEYHPYGSTAWQATDSSVKAASRRYRFTGMERDEETGLSYHRARYYIPWLGRWTAPDPIGIEGGVNLYCYCSCNPVCNSDTSGKIPLPGMGGGDIILSQRGFENNEQRTQYAEIDQKVTEEAAREIIPAMVFAGGIATLAGVAHKGYTMYKLAKTVDHVGDVYKLLTTAQKAAIGFGVIQTYQAVDDTQQAARQMLGDDNAQSLTASTTEKICNYATDGEVPEACAVSGVLMQASVGLGSGAMFSKLENPGTLLQASRALTAGDEPEKIAVMLENNHSEMNHMLNKKALYKEWSTLKSDPNFVHTEAGKKRIGMLEDELGVYAQEGSIENEIKRINVVREDLNGILNANQSRKVLSEAVGEYTAPPTQGWQMLNSADETYTTYTYTPFLLYNIKFAYEGARQNH